MKPELKKSFAIAGAAVIVGATAIFGPSIYASREDGEKYLESKGYQVTGGGSLDHFNSCGKNVPARSFSVITPDGKHKNQTVCYGLFGKHFPLFGE